MLCVTLKGYVRACAPTTGGLSAAWVFDPSDFDFTTGTSGANSYASVARRTGATAVGGAKMFPINFMVDEGSFKTTQKANAGFSSWDYELSLQLQQLSQDMSDFVNQLAVAAICCGLGLIVQLNDGSLIVMGEKYVNAAQIPRWVMKMDGTVFDTGKTFTEFNGATLVLKGTYSRAPNFFTGGIAAITALEV